MCGRTFASILVFIKKTFRFLGKDILSKPVEPPPLDNSFPVDFADELEEDNNSGGRDSPVPKLKVKFASHLGLSKKKSPGSSSLKPFVNPRSSAKNLPPMPNLVTPSLPTLTKKFPTLKAPTISKQPGKHLSYKSYEFCCLKLGCNEVQLTWTEVAELVKHCFFFFFFFAEIFRTF